MITCCNRFGRLFTGPEPWIEPDTLEQTWRMAYMVSSGFFKNVLCHFFPRIGSFSYSYMEVNQSNAFMTQHATSALLSEVEEMKGYAGLSKAVDLYTGTMHSMHSYGGQCSLTHTFISIPQHYITRPDAPDFGKELSGELQNSLVHFSDDQTRFLLAREIGYIKHNHTFLRTVIKIALLAAGLLASIPPYGALLGLLAGSAALACYVANERSFQQKIDAVSINILEKKYGDRNKAVQIGIDTLEKMRQRNLEKRKQNPKTELYLSEEGNNWFDITTPSLTSRIEKLKRLV